MLHNLGFPNLVFFALIALTGALTAATDLTNKKIQNIHLLPIAAIAVILYAWSGTITQTAPILQIWDFSAAILITMILYSQKLWKAGDAKLFVVYALLMPATGYEHAIRLPCFALFANTFLLGLLFLTPSLCQDMYIHRKKAYEFLCSRAFYKVLMNSLMITLCITWMIFPILHWSGLGTHRTLSFSLNYIIIYTIYNLVHFRAVSKLVRWGAFAVGLLLHIFFFPTFFTLTNILLYLKTVLIYLVFFVILKDTMRYVEGAKDRIPFAPFLFLGCVLSYTPFLVWIMPLLKR
ncbi:MAG: hypothetical protein HQL19_01460 [Candidatus Omnitrophica bacterium]|nr:hypothetical protein [Candidatus Omnitrophota bacterium]